MEVKVVLPTALTIVEKSKLESRKNNILIPMMLVFTFLPMLFLSWKEIPNLIPLLGQAIRGR